MDKRLIEIAINNCWLTHQYGNPGMEDGMCAGLRTMDGEGEPIQHCKECMFQYQNERED